MNTKEKVANESRGIFMDIIVMLASSSLVLAVLLYPVILIFSAGADVKAARKKIKKRTPK